jgi:hypothetical protein
MFDPLKYSNHIFYNTPKGVKYLKLREKFDKISRKFVQDRKEEHLRNPDILRDTKNLSFLDVLLTVKYDC